MTGSSAIVRKDTSLIRLITKIEATAPIKDKSVLMTAICDGLNLEVFILFSPFSKSGFLCVRIGGLFFFLNSL